MKIPSVLRRRVPRATILSAAGWVAVGCGTARDASELTEEALGATGVSGSLSLQSDWGQGYCANVTVTNSGSATTTSWTAVVNLNQSALSNAWSATTALSGTTLTATPLSWNAALAPNASTTFGFCATATGTNYHPTLVSLTLAGAGSTGTSGTATGGSGSASGSTGSTAGTSGSTGTSGGTAGTSGSTGRVDGGAGMSGSAGSSGTTTGSSGTTTGTSGSTAEDAGASTGSSGSGKTAGTPGASDIVVDPTKAHQHISGFGASTAWLGVTMSASDADLVFSPTAGAGLSLHRIRIAPGGTTTETGDALLSQARGATVWATPWTPPPGDKSSDSTVEGTLTNPSDFTATLVKFVQSMKSSGVNIYAISAQNEPDANVTYESCAYTPAQLATFIGASFGPALAGTGVKLMGPETQNWCGFPSYASAIEGNAAAWSALSIIATHEYGCTPAKAFPDAQAAGKEFWETEIYDTGAVDPGIGSALKIAGLMYDALANANMNAWHHWWVYPGANDNSGLFDDSSPHKPTKRLYVMGNFARFVRPGYNRIDVTTTHVPSGVSVIAFSNAADNTTVIVAINTNTASATVPLFVGGAEWPAQVTPWVTSSSASLASQTSIPLTGARFSATLAAQSVTTFVGKP
ncbi:MAG TPA: cellulose binding domain-containing protein [Polyangiaceae bacterium]|nr:cellulose binding domain-containing protein [Polyangiaceae bacterium]